MHEIIFYQDRNGRQPVLDYMEKLGKSKSKDSRIKLNKISDYIQALSVYGTEQLTENYVKHLDGEIWELRPIRDRILFAAVVNGRYVLLHQFMKKTQKTPAREIEQAKRELADLSDMSSVGRTWADVRKELLTPEEIAESDLRVALIGELIKARKERGLSQRELEALSGVKQPVIARMENGSTVPNLNTILKVLAPLGKTLYIGDLK